MGLTFDNLKAEFILEANESNGMMTNYFIFGILGFLLITSVLAEIGYYYADEKALTNASAEYVKESATPTKASSETILYKVFSLLSAIKKKGFAEATEPSQVSETNIVDTNRHISNVELINENIKTARAVQNYIDGDLIRGPITFYKVLKHLHFYLSLVVKSEINTPRSVKLLIGLSAILGEFALTGIFGIFSIVTAACASALLMILLKMALSVLLTKEYLTESMTSAEMEACEATHMKRRVVGMLMAALWIMGCVAGIAVFALGLTEAETGYWMTAFAIAAALELIVFPAAKIAFVVGFGLKLAGMIKERTKMIKSKAFAAAMDFSVNYF